MKDNFEDFFQKSFEDASLTPSSKIWKNIEQHNRVNNRATINTSSYFSVGLAVILLISLLFNNANQKEVSFKNRKRLNLFQPV